MHIKKLIERIEFLGKAPEDPDKFTTWIKADGHLALLRDNAKEDELIIYGSGIYSFIYAVVVSEENLSPLDKDDLLKWNGKHPFSPCASYIYSGAKDEIWIEGSDFCTNTLKGAQQLVFARTFEGMKGKERSYFEILQEYAHVTGIHWRRERHAYGHFDKNGEFDPIVSITSREDQGDITLVSFKRKPLEKISRCHKLGFGSYVRLHPTYGEKTSLLYLMVPKRCLKRVVIVSTDKRSILGREDTHVGFRSSVPGAQRLKYSRPQ